MRDDTKRPDPGTASVGGEPQYGTICSRIRSPSEHVCLSVSSRSFSFLCRSRSRLSARKSLRSTDFGRLRRWALPSCPEVAIHHAHAPVDRDLRARCQKLGGCVVRFSSSSESSIHLALRFISDFQSNPAPPGGFPGKFCPARCGLRCIAIHHFARRGGATGPASCRPV